MTTLLLPFAPLLPLLLAPFAAAGNVPRWLPIAALPAIASALLVPVGTAVELPWLMLGTQLALDATGRLFLLFSGVVWFAAALYLVAGPAQWPSRGRFAVWFLAAMAGNVLLILAADMVTFYFGFTMMGLSAYGMLLGRPGQRARSAGRVYLAFTLIGEVALFAALVLLASHAGGVRFADLVQQPLPDSALALLLFGFGIKVALPGLHLWLPPAYTTGPVVAVAVLSGPMMKAGLLGWLRFVPPTAVDGEGWGTLLVVLGAIGVLIGVGLGVLQRHPRAVLAYSSIAKMGLISALFGMALLDPVQAPALLAALVLFAMHHLLVKSALFLGVGEWERNGQRTWVLVGLGLLALTLVGAPLSGGAAAKAALADATLAGPVGLDVLLTAAAIGTVLLMARFFVLLLRVTVRRETPARVAAAAWLGLLAVAFWGPFPPAQVVFDIKAIWPIAAGLLLVVPVRLMARRWSGQSRFAGDGRLLRLPVRYAMALRHAAARLRWPFARSYFDTDRRIAAAEAAEVSLQGAGLRWLAVLAALLAAMLVFD